MTVCHRHVTIWALLGHMAHMTEKLALQSGPASEFFLILGTTQNWLVQSNVNVIYLVSKIQKGSSVFTSFLAAKGTICLLFYRGYSDMPQTTGLLATLSK